MATLEQIASALRKADAAGNVDDARALAAAYRKMKASGGGDRYSDRYTNPASKDFGMGGTSRDPAPIEAAFTNTVRSIPVAGDWLMDRAQEAKAAAHGMPVEAVRADDAATTEAQPVASTIGKVAGTVLPFVAGGAIPVVAKALGMTGSLGARAGFGALSGAGIGAADTAVRSGDADEVRNSLITGGVLGGALPLVARGVGAVFKGAPAAARAPAAAEIKADASLGYDAARASDAVIDQPALNILKHDVNAVLDEAGLLAPSGKIVKGYGRVKGAAAALKEYASGTMSARQAITLRKTFAKVAASSDKTEAGVGMMMLDQLDDFFDSLPAQAFKAGDGEAAMQVMKQAKDTYARGARTATLEKIMRDANYRATLGGGKDQALRTEAVNFLTNDKKRRGFSPDEIAAFEAFIKGGPVGNLFRVLSKAGGIPAVAAAGVGARALMGRGAQGAVGSLRDMVANGGVPLPPRGLGDMTLEALLQDIPGTSRIGPSGLAQLLSPNP